MDGDNAFSAHLKFILYIVFEKYGPNCLFIATLVKSLWIFSALDNFQKNKIVKSAPALVIHNLFTNNAKNMQFEPYFTKLINNTTFRGNQNTLSSSIFMKISFSRKNYDICTFTQFHQYQNLAYFLPFSYLNDLHICY